MPRFYVKNNKNRWNIFSTIVDDFLYDNWLQFNDLVEVVINEVVEAKKKELKTLLTDKPELNIISYDEALRRLGVDK